MTIPPSPLSPFPSVSSCLSSNVTTQTHPQRDAVLLVEALRLHHTSVFQPTINLTHRTLGNLLHNHLPNLNDEYPLLRTSPSLGLTTVNLRLDSSSLRMVTIEAIRRKQNTDLSRDTNSKEDSMDNSKEVDMVTEYRLGLDVECELARNRWSKKLMM